MSSMLSEALPGLESAICCDSVKADPPLPKLLVSGPPRRSVAEISAESELSKISLSFLLDFFFDLVFFFFFVFLTFFFFLDDFAGNTGVGAKAELQEERSESSSVNLSPIVPSAIYAEWRRLRNRKQSFLKNPKDACRKPQTCFLTQKAMPESVCTAKQSARDPKSPRERDHKMPLNDANEKHGNLENPHQ